MPDLARILWALAIFAARVIGVTIGTIRVIISIRGHRFLAAAMGFLESLIYVLLISKVLQDISDPLSVAAYSMGFGAGVYVGMLLESRLIQGYVTINIVSVAHAHDVAEAIRAAGFGATEGWGHGAGGFVGWVRTVVRRNEADSVRKIVHEVDPDAFLTQEEVRSIQRGYLRSARRPER